MKKAYELQQISVWGRRYPKRKMHLNRIGLLDSLKNAEESMRLYIQAEKERYKSWGHDDYKKECLGYLISSQQVLHCELPDFSFHPKWWSYNVDGGTNDHSLVSQYKVDKSIWCQLALIGTENSRSILIALAE